MNYFTRHNLFKQNDEYTLVLYADQQLYEFAQEFYSGEETTKKVFENKVLDYIKDNLPNIKIKTVKIMVGTLLIAAIPFHAIEAKAQRVDYSQNKVSSQNVYTVKSGDTLYKISNNFNTTINDIKTLNDLSSDLIYAGQQLKIPENTENMYVVKSGDTLYKISKEYNITVNELKIINNLQSNLIFPGQIIGLSMPYHLNYIVREGDYLYKIAMQFDTTVSRIKEFNRLISYNIYSGQALKIPLEESSAIVENPFNILVVANKSNRLPSNYIPDNLEVPDIPFTFKEYSSKKLMKKEAKEAIEKLFAKAKEENINLLALSGYRSYEYQEYLFTSKAMERGIDIANMTSALPGQSEHQTGLAMDVTSASANYRLTQYFGSTKEGIWLKNNAAEYGFIIRYPQGKEEITGYSYEPWHIRYVGVEAAKIINEMGIALEEYMNIET